MHPVHPKPPSLTQETGSYHVPTLAVSITQAKLGTKSKRARLWVHAAPELIALGILPKQDVVGMGSHCEVLNAKVWDLVNRDLMHPA